MVKKKIPLRKCSGCGEMKPKKELIRVVKAPDVKDEEGNVVISAAGISETAVFYNYDADGITVQLVAIRDENGKAHIAFNTCQSCSPSPKAYYTQQGALLKCANCGFTFAPEEVGVVQGGCNPWPIEKAVFENDRIIIPASALEKMRGTFVSWQGPTE